MKKILTLALAMLLCLSALSGCKEEKKYDEMPEGFLEDTKAEKKDEPEEKAETDFDIPVREGLDFDYDMSEYITLADYKSDDFVFDRFPTDEKTIDAGIEKLRMNSKYAVITSVDRGAEMGDMVAFDYTSTYEDGTNAISGTNVSILMGSDFFAPGFDKFLEGVKSNFSGSFNFAFPADWTNIMDVAGRTSTFSVKVKGVYEVTLADIHAVMEENGAETEEELRELVLDGIVKSNTYYFLNALVDKSSVISYPEKELNVCKAAFDANIAARAKAYGTDVQGFIASEYPSTDAFNTERETTSKQECKRYMVIYALQDIYGCEVSRNEYNLVLQDYYETEGEAMSLNSVEEVYNNMGLVLAESLLADAVAQAAYNSL